MASCGGGDEESTNCKFQLATDYVKSIAQQLDSNALLYFYARFKQVHDGVCNVQAPSFIDFSGKQKWRAWKNLENMDKVQAMTEYIEMLNEIRPDWDTEESLNEGEGGKGAPAALGITVSKPQQVDDAIRDEDKTPFDWVKENNVTKLKELLEAKKLNLTEKDDEGLTYLHWACDRGHIEVIRFLLENGALVNSQDHEGLTPLHYVV